MNTLFIFISIIGLAILIILAAGLLAALGKESRSMEDFLTDMHKLENTTWKYDTSETTTSGSPVINK